MYTQPLPYYSLYDLYTDINNGRINEFTYNGEKFTTKRVGIKWQVTHIN